VDKLTESPRFPEGGDWLLWWCLYCTHWHPVVLPDGLRAWQNGGCSALESYPTAMAFFNTVGAAYTFGVVTFVVEGLRYAASGNLYPEP